MPRTKMSGDDAIDDTVMHGKHKERHRTEIVGGLEVCVLDDDKVVRLVKLTRQLTSQRTGSNHFHSKSLCCLTQGEVLPDTR